MGRVKSLPRDIYSLSDGRFLRFKPTNIKTPKETPDGYYAVTLSVEGINKTIGIHILVAEAFIEKPMSEQPLEINHIDFDRKNNRVDNLEWLTHQDNISYSASIGHYAKPYGEDHPEKAELLARSGRQNGMHVELDLLDLDGNFIKHFDLMEDCARYIKTREGLTSSVNSIRQRICTASKKGSIVYKKYKIRRTND